MRHLCIIAAQFLVATPCIATPSEHRVVGLAVIKQPRVGSTWVKKEFNSLPGVHLEFEPLTDGAHRCPPNFTNAVLNHMMREPLRCVNRKSRAKPCYWTKCGCDVSTLLQLGGLANKSATEISGFLIHHIYVPSASWPFLLAHPRHRLVILRRTNIVKRTVSNMLRVAEDDDDDDEQSTSKPTTKTTAVATTPAPKHVDPSELLRQARLSMLSLLRMPHGIDFYSDEHFLILYEDLQNGRTQVLTALLRWLGKPHLVESLPPTTAATHWTKAPESLCTQLTNCEAIKQKLSSAPCFSKRMRTDACMHTHTTALSHAFVLDSLTRTQSCSPLLRPRGRYPSTRRAERSTRVGTAMSCPS